MSHRILHVGGFLLPAFYQKQKDYGWPGQPCSDAAKDVTTADVAPDVLA
jgi:hypothetical protein